MQRLTLSPLEQLIRQFFWFGIGGALGFCVDASVLWLMMHKAGFGLYGGRIISYLCAVTFTYFFSRQIVFRQAPRRPIARQWSRFAAANLVGFAFNYGTYALLAANVALVHDWPVLGVAAGSLAGMFANFFLSRSLVFGVS